MVIDIQPSEMEQIQEKAHKLGVDAESIVHFALNDFLHKTVENESDFDAIIEYVVRKNAELYKRLA